MSKSSESQSSSDNNVESSAQQLRGYSGDQDNHLHARAEFGHKPSVGERIVGDAEKFAGAVAMDPNLMAKGKEKKNGGPLASALDEDYANLSNDND